MATLLRLGFSKQIIEIVNLVLIGIVIWFKVVIIHQTVFKVVKAVIIIRIIVKIVFFKVVLVKIIEAVFVLLLFEPGPCRRLLFYRRLVSLRLFLFINPIFVIQVIQFGIAVVQLHSQNDDEDKDDNHAEACYEDHHLDMLVDKTSYLAHQGIIRLLFCAAGSFITLVCPLAVVILVIPFIPVAVHGIHDIEPVFFRILPCREIFSVQRQGHFLECLWQFLAGFFTEKCYRCRIGDIYLLKRRKSCVVCIVKEEVAFSFPVQKIAERNPA